MTTSGALEQCIPCGTRLDRDEGTTAWSVNALAMNGLCPKRRNLVAVPLVPSTED